MVNGNENGKRPYLFTNELKYMLHLEKKFNKAALGFTRWPEIYYCNKKIEKPHM